MTTNNKEVEEIADQTEWDNKFKTILGGYCWAQDGGNGGYDYEDVIAHIMILVASRDTYWKERVRKEVEGIDHLIHERSLAQNRNGIDYCSCCEQAYEECSCPARNSGAEKMKYRILQALYNLK